MRPVPSVGVRRAIMGRDCSRGREWWGGRFGDRPEEARFTQRREDAKERQVEGVALSSTRLGPSRSLPDCRLIS
jgi:hypothetical protein